MISILVLTKNEELDIASCLESVSWSDDIHVFDSCSTDQTIDIASSSGAYVYQHPFSGYASQRNAAFEKCAFAHDWILILDADERFPKESAERLLRLVHSIPSEVGAFRLQRRDFFGDSWLKHAQMSPYYIRLVRKGNVRYHREINEVTEVSGKIMDTDIYFDHYPFSKGMDSWKERHMKYAEMEAIRLIDERRGMHPFSIWKAIFHPDFHVRRFHQKGMFYRMPFRPYIKWIYLVLFRLAFLDGLAGLRYAKLLFEYEKNIDKKVLELTVDPRAC